MHHIQRVRKQNRETSVSNKIRAYEMETIAISFGFLCRVFTYSS